jgi:hydrogenase expression/formation protein HypC
MCWAVPGKVIEVNGNTSLVEVSGIQKSVSLDLLSDVKPGEYVIVHAGFAIQKVDKESAEFTIEFFDGKKPY